MIRRLAALPLLLAACGADPVLYAAPPPVPAGERIAVFASSIEVREVSLPLYAESEEVHVGMPGGAIAPLEGARWADDPRRAVTLELASALATATGARVASEPWPYQSFPEATVTVRATQMLAGIDGLFRMSGQWATGDHDGERERAGRFEVTAPIAPGTGIAGIAAARAVAVRDLARTIASRGL